MTITPQATAPTQQKGANTKRRKKAKPKGPPKGFFEVDETKPYAILGDKAQLEVFVPADGPDRPEWLNKAVAPYDEPSAVGENEATLSEMLSETPSIRTSRDSSAHDSFDSFREEDLMTQEGKLLVDLAQQTLLANGLGQSMFAAMQDHTFDPEEPENEGDLPGDFRNFFNVPGDTDSSDDEANNISSSQQSSSVFKVPDLAFSQVHAGNVGSFRRSADPMMATLASSYDINMLPPLTIPTTKQGHKRKASDSPYDSPIYAGVTPVQRVIRTSKRRKILTTETTA